MDIRSKRLSEYVNNLVLVLNSICCIFHNNDQNVLRLLRSLRDDSLPYLDLDLLRSDRISWMEADGRRVLPEAVDAEVAWQIYPGIRVNRPVLLHGRYSPFICAYLRRYGVTTLSISSGDEFELVDCQSVSVKWLEEFVTKRVYGYGEWPSFKGSLPTIAKEGAVFGKAVRQRLMAHARDHDETYVGCGDTVESVVGASIIGCRSEHVNWHVIPPRLVTQSSDCELYRVDFQHFQSTAKKRSYPTGRVPTLPEYADALRDAVFIAAGPGSGKTTSVILLSEMDESRVYFDMDDYFSGPVRVSDGAEITKSLWNENFGNPAYEWRISPSRVLEVAAALKKRGKRCVFMGMAVNYKKIGELPFGDRFWLEVPYSVRIPRLRARGWNQVQIDRADNLTALKWANALGVSIIMANDYPPRTLARHILNHLNTGVDARRGESQEKLWITSVPMFVGTHDAVLIVGGSPGHHLDQLKDTTKKIIIVDPLPVATSANVTHFAEVYDIGKSYVPSGMSYTLILDIRKERRDMDYDTWEASIVDDHDTMLSIAGKHRMDPNFRRGVMKVRTMRNRPTIRLPGNSMLCLQPRVWSRSTETRCIFGSGETTTEVDRNIYDFATSEWNALRWRNIDVELEQADRIISTVIVQQNMFSYRSKSKSPHYVMCFSASNFKNAPSMVKAYASMRDHKFTMLLPTISAADNWVDGQWGVRFEKDIKSGRLKLIQRVKAETYYDWVYSPTEFLRYPNASVLCLRDLFTGIDVDSITLRRNKFSTPGFDGMHPFMNLWMVVTSYEFWNYKMQSWINSQTHYVRVMTPAMRLIYGHDKDTLHRFRRAAIRILLKGSVTIRDLRINGYVMREGHKYFIAVSGHMVNIMLAARFTAVDMKRYLDTVEHNVFCFTNRIVDDPAKYHLAESNWTGRPFLWHSYIEFYIAVACYFLVCKALNVPADMMMMRYVLQRLEKIKKQYPKFSEMGFQARKFVIQGKRNLNTE